MPSIKTLINERRIPLEIADDLAIGLEFESAKGRGTILASGAVDKFSAYGNAINQGVIINSVLRNVESFLDTDLETDSKFGELCYRMGSTNVLAFPGQHNNPREGSLTIWFKNLSPDDVIAENIGYGVRLRLDSSGFLEFRITDQTATLETDKTQHIVVGSVDRSLDANYHNVIVTWRINNGEGSGTDQMEMYFDNVIEGTAIINSDIFINDGDGGNWFFGSGQIEPTWNHVYVANGTDLPTDIVDAWAQVGDLAAGGVAANGNLSIDPVGNGSGTAANTTFYQKTTNIDLSDMTMTWKNTSGNNIRGGITSDGISIRIVDSSLSRVIEIQHFEQSIGIIFLGTGGVAIQAAEIRLNRQTPNIMWLTTSGSPDMEVKLYIDGILVFKEDNNVANSDFGGDALFFGDFSTTVNGISNWEFFKYKTGADDPVVSGATDNGRLDSIGVVNGIISEGTRGRLQLNPVTKVFRHTPRYGIWLPPLIHTGRSGGSGTSTTSTTYENMGFGEGARYYIAGDSVSKVGFIGGATVLHSVGSEEIDMVVSIRNLRNGSGTDEIGSGSFGGNHNASRWRDPGAGSIDGTLIVTRQEVFDIGLHECILGWKVGASTGSMGPSESMKWDVYIAQDKKLKGSKIR